MNPGKQISLFDEGPELPVETLTPQVIYENASQGLLERLREDNRFERKRAASNTADLGTYFSMWANTPGGGLIVCGIEDDGTITGWRGKENKLNDCERAPHQYCPEAVYRTKRVPVIHHDGTHDFVVLFQVDYHETRVVRTVNGKAYDRRADQRHELKDLEVRSLEIAKGQIQFEQEACPMAFPDDFDMGAIDEWVEAVRLQTPVYRERATTQVLVLRGLGKMEGARFVPNYACALLFGHMPSLVLPGAKIRFLRFEGKEEGTGATWNAVKDTFIEGPIPRLIADVEVLLDGQLRTFSKLDRQQRFTPSLEYPKEAWYEALVNACIHRSYGNGHMNMTTTIKMFDDRLVIESPGAFPAYVTPDNIYDGIHHPRNPKLAEALIYSGLVRCANEGTRRMRLVMRENNLPDPRFEQEQVGYAKVRVVLRNNVEQRKAWIDRDVSAIIGKSLAAQLDDKDRQILNYLAENGTINISDAQRVTKLSWPATKRKLINLKNKGIIQHIENKGVGKSRDPNAYFILPGRDPGRHH